MDSHEKVEYSYSYTYKDKKFSKLSQNLLIYILEFNNKNDCWKISRIKNQKLTKALINSKNTPISYFHTNPAKLQFNQMITDYDEGTLPNMIAIYENVHRKIILAYSSKNYSINLLQIVTRRVDGTLKGHRSSIKCIKYYYDSNSEKLISSSTDNSIIIWNLINYSCQIRLTDLYNSSYIFSCLLVNIDDNPFIISSALSNEVMKIFCLDGEFQGDLGSRDFTIFIDYWFDPFQIEHYIINCNNHNVKLYNFRTKELYKSFRAKDCFHHTAFITTQNKCHRLFVSDSRGYISIWNVYTQIMESSIFVGIHLKTIISWNDDYVLVTEKEKIKIVDLIILFANQL